MKIFHSFHPIAQAQQTYYQVLTDFKAYFCTWSLELSNGIIFGVVLTVLAVAMNRAVCTEKMSLFRSAGFIITLIIRFVIKVMTGKVQK